LLILRYHAVGSSVVLAGEHVFVVGYILQIEGKFEGAFLEFSAVRQFDVGPEILGLFL
jgi:hypothetical protein